ncbi:MAG: hypothetical protein HY791_08040 [Deltaproteobacteria bacterium]|nr:hypothetical protein [Deltaproteobacteria bacterium]
MLAIAPALSCAAQTPNPTQELVEIVNTTSCREILRKAAREKDAALRATERPPPVDPAAVDGLDLPRSSSSTTSTVGRWVRFSSSSTTLDEWPLGRTDEETAEELARRFAETEPEEAPIGVAASRAQPVRALEGLISAATRYHGEARLSFAVRRSHELPGLEKLTWEVRRSLELGRISALGRSSEGLGEPLEWPPLKELVERCEIDVEQLEDALAVLHAAHRPMSVEFVGAHIRAATDSATRPTIALDSGRVRVSSIIGSAEISLGAPREVIWRKLRDFLAASNPSWTWTLLLGDGSTSDLVTLLAATGPEGIFFAPTGLERQPSPTLRVERYPELPSSESPRLWRATLRGLLDELATCPRVATFRRIHAELSISGDGKISAQSIALTSPDLAVETCLKAKLTGFRLLPSQVTDLRLDIAPVDSKSQ